MDTSPELTVCICTRDRPGYLRGCLDGLSRQDVAPQRLVIDSASAAEAATEIAGIVSALPRARLLRLDRPGLSIARNHGARAALGGTIAYIDDDAVPDPSWVRSTLRALSEGDPTPIALGGRILPLWEAPLPGWWLR